MVLRMILQIDVGAGPFGCEGDVRNVLECQSSRRASAGASAGSCRMSTRQADHARVDYGGVRDGLEQR